MTLEIAIEQNTAAIQQLIIKMETWAPHNDYRRAKAIEVEPNDQVDPPIHTPSELQPLPRSAPKTTPISVTQDPMYKELTERLLTVSKINRNGAMAQLRKVMSEYDVTHVKDLAPEALPKVLNRFNELCGEIA